ncbi:hypothetical protein GCM10009720_24600 [Yaniella flava]|uniref:HTH tetR-type domain-containing protein n=1 Tax=Yaniella flava TaxID=287930 RepID=A0ABN2USX2_9MICC|nr:TetR/AcrR family transcriptional regulator [Micrococcaceae bacterium]
MQNDREPVAQKKLSFIEEARRGQIVDAAAATVAELGYAQTSLARIADRAQISKGVITYHFATKDEILRLVVTQFFEQGWEFMEGRILTQDTALGQLLAWIGAELEFFAAHRTGFLAMSDIVANHRGTDGSHAFGDEFAEEIQGLTDILLGGQQDGELRAFDARSVAQIILRTVDGLLMSWATDPTCDLAEQTPVLLDFIVHAIRAESS